MNTVKELAFDRKFYQKPAPLIDRFLICFFRIPKMAAPLVGEIIAIAVVALLIYNDASSFWISTTEGVFLGFLHHHAFGAQHHAFDLWHEVFSLYSHAQQSLKTPVRI